MQSEASQDEACLCLLPVLQASASAAAYDTACASKNNISSTLGQLREGRPTELADICGEGEGLGFAGYICECNRGWQTLPSVLECCIAMPMLSGTRSKRNRLEGSGEQTTTGAGGTTGVDTSSLPV